MTYNLSSGTLKSYALCQLCYTAISVVVLLCSIDICKQLIGSNMNIIESVESKDLKRVLYELCWSGVNGRLKVDQVTATLANIAVSRVRHLTKFF